MTQLKVIYRDINELKEYENNPRRITDEAVDKVVKSIEQFGLTNPILIDRNDIIVAGHTRIRACRKAGITDIPTINLEDLSEEQVKAYRLVDNKTGEYTGWDFAKLDLELDDILGDGLVDMGDFGFKGIEDINIDDLFEKQEQADSTPREPKKVQCPVCGEWFEI